LWGVFAVLAGVALGAAASIVLAPAVFAAPPHAPSSAVPRRKAPTAANRRARLAAHFPQWLPRHMRDTTARRPQAQPRAEAPAPKSRPPMLHFFAVCCAAAFLVLLGTWLMLSEESVDALLLFLAGPGCDATSGVRLLAAALLPLTPLPRVIPFFVAKNDVLGAPTSLLFAPAMVVTSGSSLLTHGGSADVTHAPLCVFVGVPLVADVLAYREAADESPLVVVNSSSYEELPRLVNGNVATAPDTLIVHVICDGEVLQSVVPDWVSSSGTGGQATRPFNAYSVKVDTAFLPRRSGGAACALHVRVEHRSWTWHATPVRMPVFWPERPVPGLVEIASPLAVYDPDVLPPWPITVEDARPLASPPAPLPLCNWALSTAGGHWGAGIPPLGALASADGRFWAPRSCRLREFDSSAANGCLQRAGSVFHFIGDSNTRRYVKSLSGLLKGTPWCGGDGAINDRRSNVCECEDAPEFDADFFSETFPADNELSPGVKLVRSTLRGVGSDSEIDATLERMGSAAQPMDCPPGSQEPSAPPCPAAVFVQMVVWDAAWQSLARVERGLARLVAGLEALYPHPGTRIVYRSANHHCCAEHAAYLFYTSGRVRLFNELVQQRLEASFGTRLRVVDVFAMGAMRNASRSAALTRRCAGHEPSEDIDVENQVLLNGLCNQEE
jgi:hypothetical protein